MKIYANLILGLFISVSTGMVLPAPITRSQQLIGNPDSAGFTSYPDAYVLDNLKPDHGYKQLEINTIVPGYRRTTYRNLYRFPRTARPFPDSIVLTKSDLSKSFSIEVHPGLLNWYISALDTKNKLITINDTSMMKPFLHNLKNKFNAYLWFQLKIGSSEIPIKTVHTFSYKKVFHGYLIRYRALLTTIPVSTAELTYFVGDNFRVRLVEKKGIRVSKYSYK